MKLKISGRMTPVAGLAICALLPLSYLSPAAGTSAPLSAVRTEASADLLAHGALNDDPTEGEWELPEGVTAEEHARWLEVDTFVQGVMDHFGDRVNPSVDWERNVILLSAAPSALPQVEERASTEVAGLKVDVQPALITIPQYESAILRMSASGLLDEAASFNLPGDSSAVEVKIPALAKLGELERSALLVGLTKAAEAPVRLRAARTWTDTTRQDFAAPFPGGGHITHYIDATPDRLAHCSTGFAVLSGTNGFLLSAAHCDESGAATNWSWRDANRSTPVTAGGAAVRLSGTQLDSMIMDPEGSTEGKIFGGAWGQASGTARFKLQVAGADNTFEGAWVCTGGGVSGEHCDTIVRHRDDVACGTDVCHRWEAQGRWPGTTVVAGGDSGGPVYTDLGQDRVGARGVIQAGSAPLTSCGSQAIPSACYNWVRFAGIYDVLARWQVKIETTP